MERSGEHGHPVARLNYLQTYILGRLADDPGSRVFNLAKLFRLRRGIDLEKLARSLEASGLSHAAIRTVLRKDAAGGFVQRPELPDKAIRCPIVKTSEAGLLARKGTLVKTFDLDGGALFDAAIFDCGGNAYLLSNFHHLICDGYSFPLILEDARRAWNGETLKPDSYYEILARREEKAVSPTAVAGRRFFRKVLEGRTFLTLPPDDSRGASGYGTVDAPLATPDAFDAFLAARRVTRHHVFLAAAALALRGVSGEKDVLLDWVFHGRISKDELKTVGAFMVDLPLVFDGPAGMTSLEALALVKRATFNGIKGVNAFRDVRDCNPTGQDRLTFNYQNEWGELVDAGPVNPDGPYAWMIEETIPLSAPAVENPFNVSVLERGGSSRLFIEYDTGRYSEGVVRRYAGLFRKSLEWLVDGR